MSSRDEIKASSIVHMDTPANVMAKPSFGECRGILRNLRAGIKARECQDQLGQVGAIRARV